VTAGTAGRAARDLVGHRHASRRALGLGGAELAAHVVLAHADARRRPVDILPPEGEQLALAQAGHRGCEEDRPVERAKLARPGMLDQRVDLVD
jgi:hypothetical protein